MLRPDPSAQSGNRSIVVMVLIFVLALAVIAYVHHRHTLSRRDVSGVPTMTSAGPAGQKTPAS
jgi:hypothetical protein